MHVLLTDALTCPRCGPDFGLILLAENIENRRVLAGWLGCANCRERYRVDRGFAALTNSGAVAGVVAVGGRDAGDAGAALRVAALVGVTKGPGLLLVVGAGALNAAAIAELVPNIEVVAAMAELRDDVEQPGVSRIGIGDRLPLRSGSMRGVALTDAASVGLIEEAARVVAQRGRVAVLSGGGESAARLTRAGMRVIASDGQAAVAERTAF